MIRFPRLHIAQSASNRILNIADEIEKDFSLSAPISVPHIPSANNLGTHIDNASTQQGDPVALPEGLGMADVMGSGSVLE